MKTIQRLTTKHLRPGMKVKFYLSWAEFKTITVVTHGRWGADVQFTDGDCCHGGVARKWFVETEEVS